MSKYVMIRCRDCRRQRIHEAKGRCSTCYHKFRCRAGVCTRCGRKKLIYAKGECKPCRDRVCRTRKRVSKRRK